MCPLGPWLLLPASPALHRISHQQPSQWSVTSHGPHRPTCIRRPIATSTSACRSNCGITGQRNGCKRLRCCHGGRRYHRGALRRRQHGFGCNIPQFRDKVPNDCPHNRLHLISGQSLDTNTPAAAEPGQGTSWPDEAQASVRTVASASSCVEPRVWVTTVNSLSTSSITISGMCSKPYTTSLDRPSAYLPSHLYLASTNSSNSAFSLRKASDAYRIRRKERWQRLLLRHRGHIHLTSARNDNSSVTLSCTPPPVTSNPMNAFDNRSRASGVNCFSSQCHAPVFQTLDMVGNTTRACVAQHHYPRQPYFNSMEMCFEGVKRSGEHGKAQNNGRRPVGSLNFLTTWLLVGFPPDSPHLIGLHCCPSLLH